MLQHLEDNINARLTLASLLLEEARDEEAISLLSPPKDSSMCSLNNYHVLYHLQDGASRYFSQGLLNIFGYFWLYADPTSSSSSKLKPWWLNEKVKLKLCHIYKTRGMIENFVEVIFPLVRESLYIETLQEKVIKITWLKTSSSTVVLNSYLVIMDFYSRLWKYEYIRAILMFTYLPIFIFMPAWISKL